MNINDFYQKLDGYFAQHDTGAIEKFMIDSLTTARTENDTAAIVAVSNELAGFYRASGNIDEAIKLSQKVLQLLKNMGEETSENFAVALQNGANIVMVAGEHETALQMFRTAERPRCGHWKSSFPCPSTNLKWRRVLSTSARCRHVLANMKTQRPHWRQQRLFTSSRQGAGILITLQRQQRWEICTITGRSQQRLRRTSGRLWN